MARAEARSWHAFIALGKRPRTSARALWDAGAGAPVEAGEAEVADLEHAPAVDARDASIG